MAGTLRDAAAFGDPTFPDFSNCVAQTANHRSVVLWPRAVPDGMVIWATLFWVKLMFS